MSFAQPVPMSFYSVQHMNRVNDVRTPTPDDYRAARKLVARDAPDLMGIIFGDAA